MSNTALLASAVMPLIILGFLWLAAGAIPAGWMAGQKGRSSLNWFLMGCVYGPFAVIMCGLSPMKTTSQEEWDRAHPEEVATRAAVEEWQRGQ